jgi:hypothetical protein
MLSTASSVYIDPNPHSNPVSSVHVNHEAVVGALLESSGERSDKDFAHGADLRVAAEAALMGAPSADPIAIESNAESKQGPELMASSSVESSGGGPETRSYPSSPVRSQAKPISNQATDSRKAVFDLSDANLQRHNDMDRDRRIAERSRSDSMTSGGAQEKSTPRIQTGAKGAAASQTLSAFTSPVFDVDEDSPRAFRDSHGGVMPETGMPVHEDRISLSLSLSLSHKVERVRYR